MAGVARQTGGDVIELVTWRDAWFEFDQPDSEETRDDYIVSTVGFVIDDGRLFLRIAQETLPGDDGYRAVTNIPQAMVLSRQLLAPWPREELT